MKYASGKFEVDLTPQQPDEEINNTDINRMNIFKLFQGDFEAERKEKNSFKLGSNL